MRITFFSNFLNHHQLPFCLEMKKLLGENFKFVATEKTPDDRIALGYDDMNNKYDFVVRSYEDEEEAYKLGVLSDVVIIGSASSKYIKERIKRKKLTFRYSERVFKSGFNFRNWLALIKNFSFPERKNVYLLCSSAYAAYDYNIAGAYINKSLKWGYFPEVKKYNLSKLLLKKNYNKKIKIVWVGRFLNFKHPEKVVEVARRLKEDNIAFSIKMIGIGPEMENIKKLVKDYNLTNEVKLLGAINNKKVRSYMEEANIYLFTSDFNEGWGAVLNEAMNSACAVVASHAIGSVPFLINHNNNGLIYKDDDFASLYDNVKLLIDNPKMMKKMGQNAYYTLLKKWNAANAAKQIVCLSKRILKNREILLPKNDICSKSKAISNKKMYNYLMRNRNDKKNN